MEGLFLLLIVLQIIISVLIQIFVPESPKFLFENGKFEQFLNSLRHIAKINGKNPDTAINIEEIKNLGRQQTSRDVQQQFTINPESEIQLQEQKPIKNEAQHQNNFGTINPVDDIEEVDNQHEGGQKLSSGDEILLDQEQGYRSKTTSMLHLFREQLYCLNTIILSLVWSSCAYSFYFTEFYMKYVPVQNIYYLSLLMGASDILTSCSFNFVKRYISTKVIVVSFSACLSAVALFLSIAIFIRGDTGLEDSHGLQVFYCLMIFGMRFFSALTFMTAYYANNEYFPTLLKGAIFALTNIVARLGSVLSPIIAESMANPSITVAVIAGITAFCSLKLSKPSADAQKSNN